MFDHYSIAARQLIFFARIEAGRIGSTEIDTEHLLMGAIRCDLPTLEKIGAPMTLEWARERAAEWRPVPAKVPDSADMSLSPDALLVLNRAAQPSEAFENTLIRTEHILLSLLLNDGHAAVMLSESGASLTRLKATVDALPRNQEQAGAGFSAADEIDLSGG